MRSRRTPFPIARAAALAVAVGVTIAAQGCGTDAVGVESCRSIEAARCRRAATCGVDLTKPVGRGDDVESCIRFYRDACLHGLASKIDPGGPGVDACVNAIAGGTCDVVLKPETDPACAFLIPVPDAAAPAAPVDSGAGG